MFAKTAASPCSVSSDNGRYRSAGTCQNFPINGQSKITSTGALAVKTNKTGGSANSKQICCGLADAGPRIQRCQRRSQSDDREHRKRKLTMVRMSNAYTAASLMIHRGTTVSSASSRSPPDTQEARSSDGMTRSKGEMVLTLMNEHLSVRPFFVGDDYTLADIALYAYTHVAHEGGYDFFESTGAKGVADRVANQPGWP